MKGSRVRTLLAALLLATAPAVRAEPAADADYAAKMQHEHQHDTANPSPAATIAPRQAVEGHDAAYGTLDGAPLRGYVAHPSAGHAGLPGLVVVHEWWGLNDNVRAMARRLAGEGYVVLAVDLYGGKVGTTSDESVALMKAAVGDPARILANLRLAAEHLRRAEKAPRVGVLGWCFGGGWALQGALDPGAAVDAAVVYYGRPVTDAAELGRLRAPLLGLYGEQDQGIPVAAVREMEAALGRLGKRATIVVYPNAAHAFANPTGERYRPEAAEDAWRRTVAFLAAELAPATP
jgi:carboxymethylenebutenolidase